MPDTAIAFWTVSVAANNLLFDIPLPESDLPNLVNTSAASLYKDHKNVIAQIQLRLLTQQKDVKYQILFLK